MNLTHGKYNDENTLIIYAPVYIWVNSHMMTKNDLITGHLNYRPPYPTTIRVLGTDSRSRVTTTDP